MFVKTSSSWCVLLLTDSLFSLDPNTTNAFFAAVLAYYSNTECDSDYTNIDIMFHNLLHSFDTYCGSEKHWNVAAICGGKYYIYTYIVLLG